MIPMSCHPKDSSSVISDRIMSLFQLMSASLFTLGLKNSGLHDGLSHWKSMSTVTFWNTERVKFWRYFWELWVSKNFWHARNLRKSKWSLIGQLSAQLWLKYTGHVTGKLILTFVRQDGDSLHKCIHKCVLKLKELHYYILTSPIGCDWDYKFNTLLHGGKEETRQWRYQYHGRLWG